MIITCSVPHARLTVGGRESLPGLTPERMECAGRGCWSLDVDRVAAADIAVVEWDLIARAGDLGGGWAHVIAVDPPYRASHLELLQALIAGGTCIHLYYGREERESTTRLLRYTVHPRFAMVCFYRALGENDDIADERVLRRAAEIGWSKAGVMLGREDLLQARRILLELGIDSAETASKRSGDGQAKMETQRIPAYAAAEADYRECLRLCQVL